MDRHYFTDNHDLPSHPITNEFSFHGHTFHLQSDTGVFSKTEVDQGTQILLEAIMQEEIQPQSLLDLGCGYGVIAVVLGHLYPNCTVTACDINPRAISLTEQNAKANEVTVETIVSNGFEQITSSFDCIVTNPPIRAGKKVMYRMFEDAHRFLQKEGTLYVVIRRQHGAESAMKKIEEVFGNCTYIERKKGYWVLKAVRN